jgi:anaphase-promoting complex subunit 11
MNEQQPPDQQLRGNSSNHIHLRIKKIRAVGEWRFDMKERKGTSKQNSNNNNSTPPPIHIRQNSQQPSSTTITTNYDLSSSSSDEDDDEPICGICRQPFDATCPSPLCLIPGDTCPPVFGACFHAFHLHCITKWLDTQPDESKKQCPMCRADFAFLPT